MIGQLKLLELRDKARTTLGAKFKPQAFHDVVLKTGTAPLDMVADRGGPLHSGNLGEKPVTGVEFGAARRDVQHIASGCAFRDDCRRCRWECSMPKPTKKTSLLGGLLARFSGRKEPPEASGPLRPFQAISIYRGLICCDMARKFSEHRFLVRDAPPLPLSGCTCARSANANTSSTGTGAPSRGD